VLAASDGPSSRPGRHANSASGVPVGGWGQESEESALTRAQAAIKGSRTARANRVSAAMSDAGDDAEPQTISGPTPLANCPGLPGTVDNYEAEPHIAINPRDPNNMIAAWQQDRSFGARGNVASFTRDGGRTWRTVTVPGADTCQPAWDRLAVADAWLTFDAAGVAYLASLPGGAFPGPGGLEIRTSVIVNRSVDGGKSWSEPSVVAPSDTDNDHEMIAADPRRDGLVYAVWSRPATPSGPVKWRTVFSRSTDGAQSWSEPSVLPAPAADISQINPRLVVLRDGGLRVFVENGERDEPRNLVMVGSEDRGDTWTDPVFLGTQTDHLPTTDGSEPFFSNFDENVTVSDDGRSLYVVFANETRDDAHAPSTVLLRRSVDGGHRWQEPEVVANLATWSGLPSVAADAAGRVAVTWYDFSRDVLGDGKATLTYRTAVRQAAVPQVGRRPHRGRHKGRRGRHGKRGGRHSKRPARRGAARGPAGSNPFRLGDLGSFDFMTCGRFSPPALPGVKWPWVADYVGLIPARDGFATAFVGCGELSKLGPEDILFAKVR
jgi:hypothetical protein